MSSCGSPRLNRVQAGETEVAVPGAKIVDLKAGDRLEGPPDDDAHPSAPESCAHAIANGLGALFRRPVIEVHRGATAAAPTDNQELVDGLFSLWCSGLRTR